MAKPRILELNVDFDKETFIKNVYDDNYILVIGSEVILNKELKQYIACNGDVNKYIVSQINNTDINYVKISEILADGDATVQMLRHAIENLDYNLNQVSPELRGLLATKLFKFVITTTIDHYLRFVMDDIWGKGNWQECSVFRQDDLHKLQTQILKKDIKPTLFYLFGHSGKNPVTSKFVAKENDAIKLIADNWIGCKEEGKTDISILKQYISTKRLLALGCKFDDWYFRFFWYSLKGGLQGQDPPGKLQEGEVAISWSNKESDCNLKRYLDNTNLVSILPDARLFMKEITTDLTSIEGEDSPLRHIILNCRHKKGIFLSYHGPDFINAFNIFQTLCNKDYLVWFDNEKLHSGDKYNIDIQKAIASCKIFMPIISDNIKANLKNLDSNKTEPYYLKEWRWAQQNQKKIMPIGINDAGKEGFEMFNNCIFGNKEEHEDEYLTGTDLSSVGAWQALIKQIEKEYSKEQ